MYFILYELFDSNIRGIDTNYNFLVLSNKGIDFFTFLIKE